MGISSIVQIASRLLNGDSGQDSQGQSKNKVAAAQAQSNRTEFGDRFTPSAQDETGNTGAGAVFFQAEQLRFTAINIQTPAGNTAATAATPAPAAEPTTAPPATAVDQTAAAPIATASAAVAAPSLTTASTLQTQQDLQALNASLSALGLNAAEIAAFDQFAGVLLQFDPNALQDLQNQLNLLAARFQTQNAAPAATPQTPAAAAPNFQLTELSISFSGLNGTLTQKNQGSGNGTTAQFSAFNLQIQEVRVTLSNPAGETAQLQVPQAITANAATTTPAAKSASA
ncbi:MAG TPA: hypothetical protein VFI38_11215 [Candidatus Acidoferrum sp.]|nr:hypothetical protein [Candidatus Acidoferrum sp.]